MIFKAEDEDILPPLEDDRLKALIFKPKGILNSSFSRIGDGMNKLPFRTLWTANLQYNNKDKVLTHNHNYYQYIFVLQGEGKIKIDNKTYLMKPDMLFMIPGNCKHGFRPEKKRSLNLAEIKFEVREEDADKPLRELPYFMEVKYNNISKIFKEILSEYSRKDSYYQDIMDTRLMNLIFMIFRIKKEGKKSCFDSNADIKKVVNYIAENLEKEITISELSEIACKEKTYFIKKFKRELGKSPIQYILDLRMSKAMQLLEFSNISISKIARDTGFASLQYFSRIFKRYTGFPPAAYRNKYSKI